MAEEHVFDRLTKAKTNEREAQQEVQTLVDAFEKASRMLQAWRVVRFRGRDEQGNSFGPLPHDRTDLTIDIQSVPSMLAIRNAIVKWTDAAGRVTAIEGSLTEEQRQTLNMRPR